MTKDFDEVLRYKKEIAKDRSFSDSLLEASRREKKREKRGIVSPVQLRVKEKSGRW